MGLCGSRIAAIDQDPDSVPVHSTSATMEKLLEEMQTPSTTVTVTLLSDPHDIPYPDGAQAVKNTEVTVAARYRAQCTGIGCIAEIGDKIFLVSDSFAPCVPIIVFAANGAWLAHSFGLSGVDQVRKVAIAHNDCDIFIISKKHARSAQIARAIFEQLGEFSVQLLDVDISGTIGVVVSAVSKTILVYRQK